ncbi:MAG: type VII secretion integral membrane protein EccD [Mycobacterium sp.]
MTESSPGLCRVALQSEAVRADLALPAGVPVAMLIPSIVDLLAARGGGRRSAAFGTAYRLSRPGEAALDVSKTLAQQAIRDGTVLLLTRGADAVPAPRFDDPAQQVSAVVRARQRPWTPRSGRLAAAVTAAGLAGVAGFIAVPGGPDAPNALLAATAAAAVAILTVRLGGCGGPVMTTVCALAVLVAAVAAVRVSTGLPAQLIGAVTVAVAVGLARAAPRVSVAFGGLTRLSGAAPDDPDGAVRAARSADLLTGLVAACSAATVLGVSSAAGTPGAHRWAGVALATASGAALLLQARRHTDRAQIAVLLAGGVSALGMALVVAAVTVPQHRPWLGATAAALAATAAGLGFAGPVRTPLARRGADLLEYLALTAVVPLACWACGWYGAVRGLGLG